MILYEFFADCQLDERKFQMYSQSIDCYCLKVGVLRQKLKKIKMYVLN